MWWFDNKPLDTMCRTAVAEWLEPQLPQTWRRRGIDHGFIAWMNLVRKHVMIVCHHSNRIFHHS